MLKPIAIPFEGRQATLRCKHEAEWPPVEVRVGLNIEAERAMGMITETRYEQIKTWQRVCGLSAMDEDTCTKCPHALREVIGRKGAISVVPHVKVVPPKKAGSKLVRGLGGGRK